MHTQRNGRDILEKIFEKQRDSSSVYGMKTADYKESIKNQDKHYEIEIKYERSQKKDQED